MNDVIGFKRFNGIEKFSVYYDKLDYLDIVDLLVDTYDEMITWEYKSKYFIFTTKEQIQTFCTYTKMSEEIDYSNHFTNIFITFLDKHKLLFRKNSIKKIRKCQQWLAEQLGIAWYKIKIDKEFKIISFNLNSQNKDYVIHI